MEMLKKYIDDLVEMSRTIGEVSLDAVILGEGNTSVLGDNGTFFVKASGCSLETLVPENAVQLYCEPLLRLLHEEDVKEERLQEVYKASKVDPLNSARPSVEAIFHAMLLRYDGITAIAHTHATAVCSLVCGTGWPNALAGRLTPDEAVLLGPESVYIDYIDPGVELAKSIKLGVDSYISKYGATPKVVYLQNHGVIALGRNTGDAVNITRMIIKAARVRLGILQSGMELHPLTSQIVGHLLGRPDEKYRQRILTKE